MYIKLSKLLKGTFQTFFYSILVFETWVALKIDVWLPEDGISPQKAFSGTWTGIRRSQKAPDFNLQIF